jgi:hypothetical protein
MAKGKGTLPESGARMKAPPKKAAAPPKKPALPESVLIKRTAEIDAKDPLASGTTAPVRKIWLEAAAAARDQRRVVIDLIGEGRGIIAIPVAFDNEREAMEVMTPALDALVTHCAAVAPAADKPVMVDLQELRERLKLETEEDWVAEHAWFHNALASREVLCMYVFSPSYLLEFSVAIGEKQKFHVGLSSKDPGFFELKPASGKIGTITWNWARAIGDVIAGGHAWSYFGMLLALAPTVAEQQRQREEKMKAKGGEEE